MTAEGLRSSEQPIPIQGALFDLVAFSASYVTPLAGPTDIWIDELHRTYAATGDVRCRNRLALHYDGFAVALARRLHSRREQAEDLVQVARVGLLNALDRFDPERGMPFVAFARLTVVGELKRHLRDKTWAVRVPRALKDHYLVVVRAADDLTSDLGRSPSIAEVARHCGLTDEQVLEAMELGRHQRPTSLDAPSDTGPDLDVGDLDAALAGVEHRELARTLIASLSARDRHVIELRFTEGLTQAEIAERIGMSQISVSRILGRILERLRAVSGLAPIA